MTHLRWFAALVLVGLTACKEPPPTCGDVVGMLVPSGSIDEDFADKVDLGTKVTRAIRESCETQKWSPAAIKCMADQRESGRDIGSVLSECAGEIGAPYAALDRELSGYSTELLGKQMARMRAKTQAEAEPPVDAAAEN